MTEKEERIKRIQKLAAEGPVSGFNPLAEERARRGLNVDRSLAGRATQGASGINEGLADLAGFPVDTMSGLLGLIGFNAGDSPIGGSKSLRGLLSPAIAPQPPEEDQAGRFIRRTGREIGASIVPTGATLTAARVGARSSIPFIQSMIQSAARNPATFAGADAALAGLSGAGAATANEMSPGNQAAELVGQMAPVGIAAAAPNAIRNLLVGGPAARSAMQDNINLFAKAGATPTVGQATPSTLGRVIESGVERAPLASAPFIDAAERIADDLARTVASTADNISTRSGSDVAGRVIKQGLIGKGGFSDRFAAKGGQLFDNASRFVPPSTPVSPQNLSRTLDEVIAPIRGAENVSGELANPKLIRIRDRLTADLGEDGTIPFEALKQLRTRIGKQISSFSMVDDIPRAELKRIYGALTKDMRDAFAASPDPKALKAFDRANKFWKSGMIRIDDFLERLAGKAEPEAIFRNLTRGTDGATKVRSVMRSLRPGEREIVAAEAMRRLGRAKPGQQSDLGELFSPETFLTNWNSLPKESKTALFSSTPKLRAYSGDLDAVASVASRIRQDARTLANPSGTAAALTNAAPMIGTVTAVATGNIGTAAAIVTGAAAANGTARLFTSPGFVRWLAKTSKVPVAQLANATARLAESVSNEDAAVQQEAGDFASLLMEQISEKPQ